jgi:putative ABC transport system permease protein
MDDVEADAPGGGSTPSSRVRTTTVAPTYFEVFGARLLAGRAFTNADTALRERPLIVNRTFVTEALGGGEVLGRRLRYRTDGDQPEPWMTIIGVVEDFPAGFKITGQTSAKMYHLGTVEEMRRGTIFVRLRGHTPESFAPMLRRIGTQVDPTLQLTAVGPLAVRYEEYGRIAATAALAIAMVTLSVLLLSAAGIHAMMSFTVNQRRREIGIRAALGAGARQILTGVLSRAARQLTVGVGLGVALSLALDAASGGELMRGKGLAIAPAIAALMVLVGLLAASGPARRGLRVHPTEAMRAE